jgi:hypothetical protein
VLHIFLIRCGECNKLIAFRKPNRAELIPKLIEAAVCPACHPELLDKCCAACRFPLDLLKPKKYGKSGAYADLCKTCKTRERRRSALQIALAS